MPLYRLFAVIALVVAVLGLSALSGRLRHSPGDAEPGVPAPLALQATTTAQEITERSGLPHPAVRQALGLRGPEDLPRSLAELGLSPEQARERLQQARALGREEGSKDWRRIVAKFALWVIVLSLAFAALRRRRVSPALRMVLLGASVAIFGVILGPSPNPMGTVKDALVLWGRAHVIFPPRMLALAVFLLLVVLANKLICGWGCHFGALQDLLFRIGRGAKPGAAAKVPFAISNGVRVAAFATIVLAALVWGTDVIEPIDPFRVYSPADLGLVGGLFLGAVLAVSPFVYRPWCHFLCPFGLVGWLAEKLSFAHVRVDYTTCVGCQRCARACPTPVMEAILKQDRIVPDCFACGECVATCPTQSVHFDSQRRTRVPAGKFPSTGSDTEGARAAPARDRP
jgi:NAD-dependent dihydropyrimidine dehydrogenase PreA subunit